MVSLMRAHSHLVFGFHCCYWYCLHLAMVGIDNTKEIIADQWWIQDFPWGTWTHWGDVDLQRRQFSAKMYAKMKEFGPVGEGRVPARPPRSANADAKTNDQTIYSGALVSVYFMNTSSTLPDGQIPLSLHPTQPCQLLCFT